MMARLCEVNGCDRRYYARDWCSAHYSRWKEYGDPLVHIPVGSMFGGELRRDPPPVNPWVDHPNPWAGQRLCPTCESSLWALPFDPTNPDTRWRCVACSAWLPVRKECAA